MKTAPTLNVRQYGLCDYQSCWQAMRDFTDQRSAETTSELWLVEHPPVFTQGQAGKAEHVLDAGDIPIVQTDRGGQVTYHGPGQIVAYTLLSLHEVGLGVRGLVSAIENAMIALLADYQVDAYARSDAPGVYINGAKIAALGLRVRKGYTYHGLAFNVDMDLEPYQRINPCGHANMPVTQARDHGIHTGINPLAHELVAHFCAQTGYKVINSQFPNPTDS